MLAAGLASMASLWAWLWQLEVQNEWGGFVACGWFPSFIYGYFLKLQCWSWAQWPTELNFLGKILKAQSSLTRFSSASRRNQTSASIFIYISLLNVKLTSSRASDLSISPGLKGWKSAEGLRYDIIALYLMILSQCCKCCKTLQLISFFSSNLHPQMKTLTLACSYYINF